MLAIVQDPQLRPPVETRAPAFARGKASLFLNRCHLDHHTPFHCEFANAQEIESRNFQLCYSVSLCYYSWKSPVILFAQPTIEIPLPTGTALQWCPVSPKCFWLVFTIVGPADMFSSDEAEVERIACRCLDAAELGR